MTIIIFTEANNVRKSAEFKSFTKAHFRISRRHLPPDTDGTKQFFATQRGYGEWKGWWEFPGGKIEEGETPEAALVREIREELTAEISAGKKICSVEYDYPSFHLSMQCFACSIISGTLTLLEHENARWLSASELHSVKWLPADEEIISKIEELL